MSGIVGIFRKDGSPVDGTDVHRMISTIAHRGTDATGIWHCDHVGFGHCAFWTTPESMGERQPLVMNSQNLVLVADARIDNRDELFGLLGRDSGSRTEVSDGQLVLRAYERWGESCPEKLLGDFSIVVWDERKQRLLCVRDHLGARPFYYFETDRYFLFASEIKALLSFPETPRKLNRERVADYLAGTFEDKTNTFYKDVLRLSPGHSLSVSSENSKLRCFWELDSSKEIRFESDADYDAAFRDIFFDAVKCRLRSSLQTGFLLSGGLDSSSVVCAARQMEADPPRNSIQAFSATFPDFPQTDEKRFVDEILRGGGIDVHYIRADQGSPFEGIVEAFERQDEPFHTPNWFVHKALVSEAKQRGVGVLLDGVDGDTTVSHGFEFLTELFFSGRWGTLVSEASWLSKRFRKSSLKFLWHYAIDPLMTRSWWWLIWKMRKDRGPWSRVPGHVNKDFAQSMGWEERYRDLLGERLFPSMTLKEDHLRFMSSGIIPFYLEVIDNASAAFGIDHRHPYFDPRLVEFCLALPPEQKLHEGWNRAIQRRALRDLLPPKVGRRLSKSIWSKMFEGSLTGNGREVLERIVLEDSGPLEEFVDMRVLRKVYQQSQSGGLDDGDILTLWAVSTLALWLERTGLAA